jgi:hypothetical protein
MEPFHLTHLAAALVEPSDHLVEVLTATRRQVTRRHRDIPDHPRVV